MAYMTATTVAARPMSSIPVPSQTFVRPPEPVTRFSPSTIGPSVKHTTQTAMRELNGSRRRSGRRGRLRQGISWSDCHRCLPSPAPGLGCACGSTQRRPSVIAQITSRNSAHHLASGRPAASKPNYRISADDRVSASPFRSPAGRRNVAVCPVSQGVSASNSSSGRVRILTGRPTGSGPGSAACRAHNVSVRRSRRQCRRASLSSGWVSILMSRPIRSGPFRPACRPPQRLVGRRSRRGCRRATRVAVGWGFR